jgi:hypothetical protein
MREPRSVNGTACRSIRFLSKVRNGDNVMRDGLWELNCF